MSTRHPTFLISLRMRDCGQILVPYFCNDQIYGSDFGSYRDVFDISSTSSLAFANCAEYGVQWHDEVSTGMSQAAAHLIGDVCTAFAVQLVLSRACMLHLPNSQPRLDILQSLSTNQAPIRQRPQLSEANNLEARPRMRLRVEFSTFSFTRHRHHLEWFHASSLKRVSAEQFQGRNCDQSLTINLII